MTFDKECVLCKVAGGIFLTGYAVATTVRIDWARLRMKERLLNVIMLGTVYGLAGLSFNAAYEIKSGKNRDSLVEIRPSYSSRFRTIYNWNTMT